MFGYKVGGLDNTVGLVWVIAIVVLVCSLVYVQGRAEQETLQQRLSDGFALYLLDRQGHVIEEYKNKSVEFDGNRLYLYPKGTDFSRPSAEAIIINSDYVPREEYRLTDWPIIYQRIYLTIAILLSITLIIGVIKSFEYLQGLNKR